MTIAGTSPTLTTFLDGAKSIVEKGRNVAVSSVNQAILITYWHLGKHIVEEEQNGEHSS